MLDIQHVSKQFGKSTHAVNDVSLKLSAGVVGLIGHNGAGKTTLMQMIATLLRPSGGQIKFQGVDIVSKPQAIRQRLGYLPQDFGVYANLTATEFLQYFAALKGVRDSQRIRQLLQMVNLHAHANHMAASFSGGMRRRLGIAQALLNDPDILIVDEPTAGLDPQERLRFRGLMTELSLKKLVILSTHIVSDVESIANELAIMRQGKLVALETPQTILQKARGQLWEVHVDGETLALLRETTQVLHTQHQGSSIQARIAHPTQPCAGALPTEPSLEEALMAQRYAQQEH